MDGFFVFGFALTTTPVPGPSSPRFPLSLINNSSEPMTLLAAPIILAFTRSGKVFSLASPRRPTFAFATPATRCDTADSAADRSLRRLTGRDAAARRPPRLSAFRSSAARPTERPQQQLPPLRQPSGAPEGLH